jgi:chromosomal replication initiator protein
LSCTFSPRSCSVLPSLPPSVISSGKPRLTIHAVKARVAAAFGISTKNKRIWLQRRSERMYSSRNVAMALARELVPDASFTKIARAFGERSHCTVLRACRSVESRCKTDDEFSSMVGGLRTILRENFESGEGNGQETD